jgi:predicted DNA repair protein MutK
LASSLFVLLDDIASVLDDVAVMTKIAGKKTAGVLGDDLALNANQVSGVQPARELPVVWAVGKGSAVNKAILIPLALLLNYLWPTMVIPLLMLGGVYLCYEGIEKLLHHWLHGKQALAEEQSERVVALANPDIDMIALEQKKIRGAIRTDFILSAEIIVISLGIVQESPFMVQLATLVAISAIMTLGVYGLVAIIVKLDDLGLHLAQQAGEHRFARWQRSLGGWILTAAPLLMKLLSVVGTLAMFLVGGGIVVHNWDWLHHQVIEWNQAIGSSGPVGQILATMLPSLMDFMVGMIVGLLTLGLVAVAKIGYARTTGSKSTAAAH